MLADMGTPGSLPKDDKDVIDMMSVLQELTFSAAERRGSCHNDCFLLVVSWLDVFVCSVCGRYG